MSTDNIPQVQSATTVSTDRPAETPKTKSQQQLRDGNQVQTFLNGTPTQVAFYPTPATDLAYIRPNLGLFAQDQWTLDHFTFNLGLRFDYFKSSIPAQSLPATQPFATPARRPSSRSRTISRRGARK